MEFLCKELTVGVINGNGVAAFFGVTHNVVVAISGTLFVMLVLFVTRRVVISSSEQFEGNDELSETINRNEGQTTFPDKVPDTPERDKRYIKA